MRIFESILDNTESSRVDVQSASASGNNDYTFDQEFAWVYCSFNPASVNIIYKYLKERLIYLLEAEAVSYSIGVFHSDDENIPENVIWTGRLEVMTDSVVVMYTPRNRKSVRLPLFVGATFYKAIRECPWITGDNDDEHYTLWRNYMDGKYHILDDYDFTLEVCSDIKQGYNTQMGTVCRAFANTVVDLSYDQVKELLMRINRSRRCSIGTRRHPVGKSEVYEGVLDNIEAREQGTSASKLADDMFHKRIDEEVQKMIEANNHRKGYMPEIDLQKYVAVWKPEVAFDLRNAVLAAIKNYGKECSLNWIDTSEITDMSHLFNIGDSKRFIGDISLWNTSSAVYMNGMFEESDFSGDISQWDVSGVKEMHKMFYNSKFNNDISGWDVSGVKIMGLMFCNSYFNRDLSSWRPVSCWNFKSMFKNSDFSGDISGWPKPDLSRNSFQKEVWVDNMFENSKVSMLSRPEWARKQNAIWHCP